MADMADLISLHEHADPDAQATVTDFIDYTEYLPSDLERALTLIGKLDHTYQTSTALLHELLKNYCKLPRGDDEQASVLEAEDLRAKISNKLDLAIQAREAAFVEATRLNNDMQRHKARLTSIHTKLLALPKPPSRDPTPQPAQSPQAARRDLLDAQRLKLRVEGARTMKKLGVRPTPRVIVPGEVLPPRNPDSPTASMYDDFTSSDSSDDELPRKPHGRPRKLFKAPKPPKIPKLKIPKIPKEKKERPPRPPRPFGVMGTNAHSAVAGISTSNALMLLEPPPPDAQLGSEHAPWTRLTEWEMAKLRKRMKKNAIWAPSDTMIRRELADSGRGADAYYAAKSRSDETGEEFVDFDDLANREHDKPLLPGEIPLEASKHKSNRAFNRGSVLIMQKRKKRDVEALQAKLEAAQANATLSSLGSKMSALFQRPLGASSEVIGDKIVLKARKRKRDSDEEDSPTEESKANAQLHSEIILASKPARKWGRQTGESLNLDDSVVTTTSTTSIPLAAAAASPKRGTPAQQASPSGTRKTKGNHVSIRDADVPNTATTSRPTSRQSSRRPSTAPDGGKDHSRRKSTTPAPQATTSTNSRLRNRRQAPGPVTNSTDGGAAVSIGKRKNAPRRKGVGNVKKDVATAAAVKTDETLITDEEAIDPNEETYCICGGVSFGIMIMCENPDCEKEWFHLECVGLKEAPARRSKWWCPDCKLKLGH